MYVVGVVTVENEELGIALAGRKDESTGLVSENLSGGVHNSGIAMMGREAWWCRGGKSVKVVGQSWSKVGILGDGRGW